MPLGRGLASLIPQKKISPQTSSQVSGSAPIVRESEDGPHKKVLQLSLSKISPNPNQPRKSFDDSVLKELADSIREHGVLQPILVREIGEGNYHIIAGERRFQASKLVGLTEIPAIVKEVSEQQNVEISLVENIQRHDLNAIEEAKAFHKLHEDYGLSQDEIAKKVGKSRAAITNTMRLLDLPEEVKNGLVEGKITEGHARAILTSDNREKQIAIYHEVLAKKLSVRQVEDLARDSSRNTKTNVPVGGAVDPLLQTRVSEIEKKVGTKVRVTKKGHRGKVSLEFFSDEELESILSNLER